MPGARELLDLWERTAGRSPVEQALCLLGEGTPEADWPLGRAQAWLLAQQARLFGSRLDLFAACPSCDEELEAGLDIPELLAMAELPEPDATVEVELGELSVRLRLPTFPDLAALVAEAEPEQALLERCVLGGARAESPAGAPPLGAEERAAIAEALAAADPLAEIEIGLVCPACDHAWDARIEPAECLSRQIEVAARRQVREIAALAQVFGWGEGEILGMSAARRRAYLEFVVEA